MCEQIHEMQIRCVYDGLSDAGILCSLILWEFIRLCDQNRLPIAELNGHYLQNSRDYNI